MVEFWDLTPAETYMAIEAAMWREEQEQRRQLAMSWRTAAFTRAKRLPPLKQVLNVGPAKPLRGKALDKRRKEFETMRKALNVPNLKKVLKHDPTR